MLAASVKTGWPCRLELASALLPQGSVFLTGQRFEAFLRRYVLSVVKPMPTSAVIVNSSLFMYIKSVRQ